MGSQTRGRAVLPVKSKIQIGNAPCSWGLLEFDGLEGEAIGYAQMLDELVETGYRGTELGDWGYLPTEPARLHAELSARGLVLLGAFVPVDLRNSDEHAEGQDAALKTARLLADVAEIAVVESGADDHLPFLVLADANGTDRVRTKHAGRVTPRLGLSATEWKSFARGAEEIARAVRQQTGLTTVFHHHCAGYVETPTEIARLLEMTDPDLLGLVLDTGHLMYGSGHNEPGALLECLDRCADRIWYVHFKDCHPEVANMARREGWDYFEALRHGIFCELGQGCVDFPAVVDWLRRRGYDGWAVVEQDVLPGMGSPRESALRNREYLRSVSV